LSVTQKLGKRGYFSKVSLWLLTEDIYYSCLREIKGLPKSKNNLHFIYPCM
jgi:hypothetical protein